MLPRGGRCRGGRRLLGCGIVRTRRRCGLGGWGGGSRLRRSSPFLGLGGSVGCRRWRGRWMLLGLELGRAGLCRILGRSGSFGLRRGGSGSCRSMLCGRSKSVSDVYDHLQGWLGETACFVLHSRFHLRLTTAYHTFTFAKYSRAYCNVFSGVKSSVYGVSTTSGSLDISSCIRTCGSHCLETRSRMTGHCSKWRAGVVCVLGIAEILVAGEIPKPLKGIDPAQDPIEALKGLLLSDTTLLLAGDMGPVGRSERLV